MSTVLMNPDGYEVEVITGRKKGGKARPGEANPMAGLSDEDARILRTMRANGWTHGDLARLFEISVGRSSEICRGNAYKAAGGPIEEGPRVYNTSLARSWSEPPEACARAIELHRQGKSQRAIAAEVGKSKTWVHDTIHGYLAMGEEAA